MPGIPCGFCAIHFWKSSFWINMRGETDSWPRLFMKSAELMFFQSNVLKSDRDIEQLLCTFCKCLIEMMTCASGEARCQEKAALEKCPANQTYILDNKDTRFVQASRGFLIWLKESCQDYYRRVNMTHSLHPNLSSVALRTAQQRNEEGTVFISRFF